MSKVRILHLVFVIFLLVASPANASDDLFTYPTSQLNGVPEVALNAVHAIPESNPAAENVTLLQVDGDAFHRHDPYVTFNFPDGRRVDYRFEETRKTDSGRIAWKGSTMDGSGHADIILDGSGVMALFSFDGRFFELLSLDDAWHALVELDIKAYPSEYHSSDTECPDEADCGIPTLPLPPNPPSPPPPDGDPAVIRMFVAYTASAENEAGNIDGRIDQFINQTNDAFENSNVDGYADVTLVGSALVNYDETGRNYDQHLDVLIDTSDGFMDELHGLRDSHAADVVALIVNDSNYCGYAPVNATPATAFLIVHYPCLNYTFPHEVGHIIGAGHNPEASSHYTPYDYGHGYQDPGHDFRTVMAYNCPGGCQRIPYFSNPNVYYDGQVTGTTDTHDVVRVIRERARTVSNFRSGDGGMPPQPPMPPACPYYDPETGTWYECP